MDRLNTLLPSALKKKGYFHDAMASLIVKRCNEWITVSCPAISGHIHAQSIKDGILQLSADHPLIITEFQQYKADLLASLRSEFPAEVKEIAIWRR